MTSDHLLIQAAQEPIEKRFAYIFSAREISLQEPLNMSNLSNHQGETPVVRPEVIKFFMFLRSEFLKDSLRLISSENVLASLHKLCVNYDFDWLWCSDSHKDSLKEALINIMSKSLVQLTCQNINRRLRQKEKEKYLKKKQDEVAKQGNGWKALYAASLQKTTAQDDDEWVDDVDVVVVAEVDDQEKSLLATCQRLANVSKNECIASYLTLGNAVDMIYVSIHVLICVLLMVKYSGVVGDEVGTHSPTWHHHLHGS